jgi:protein-tyrosine phosphatase
VIPLIDLHCHLLAGLDDGPRTEDEALAMCRIAYEDGIRFAAAGAHQNDQWHLVTPTRICQAAARLAQMLQDVSIPLSVFPCAEVMAHPEIDVSWRNGELLSVADRRQYLLLEMPRNTFIDLGDTVARLRQAGVRTILAHPERTEELLHGAGRIEKLIEAGCLIQVSAKSVTNPSSRRDEKALKRWFRRGVVHFLGSDGHSEIRRPPRMKEAYRRITQWAGIMVADQVCSTNGLAVIQALNFHPPEPRPERWWLPLFSG